MINRREFLQAAGARLALVATVPSLVHGADDVSPTVLPCDAELVDRRARVARHSPVVRVFEPFSALSVGNGAFAFTVDATGLQTFVEE